MSLPTHFERNDWNPDFRAELYKQELYGTALWGTRSSGLVPPWNDRTTAELIRLTELRAERAEHIGEIVREQDSAALVGAWFKLLGINSVTYPRTTELLHATMYLAGSVASRYKAHFNRIRPATLAPDLMPPILTPRLPSYPGGHATQIHLMALTLAHLHPSRKAEILAHAESVARNRERAGVNFPSDTDAGRKLAMNLFEILLKEGTLFKATLADSKREPSPALMDPRVLEEVESIVEPSTIRL